MSAHFLPLPLCFPPFVDLLLTHPLPALSYDACSASLQLVVDTHPHLSLGLVPIHLEYPATHAKVIEATKKAIAEEEKRGGRIRLALVDALSSNPGVVVPWEELTVIFKEHSIIRCVFLLVYPGIFFWDRWVLLTLARDASLIDAAHQIGQLPVNLRESKPGTTSSLHSHIQRRY